ncbi:MAG: hypothetical protein KGZ56_11400, partial [Dethiobacter sp.]|nr:hypothetical protein [Dethiobacter sp.]
MKIAVVGMGYVGLSLAVLLAQHIEVVATDIIKEKVDLINAKKSPIRDSEIEEFLATRELNLMATTDIYEAYRCANYVVIATPTDYDPKRNCFSTRTVEEVIANVLAINPATTMIIKSTVPVGYTQKVREMFECERFNPLILESIPLILLITQNFKKTTKIFFHPTSIWIVSSKVGLAVKAKPQKAVVVLVLGRRLVIIFQKGSSLGSGIRYHEGVCYTFTINGF